MVFFRSKIIWIHDIGIDVFLQLFNELIYFCIISDAADGQYDRHISFTDLIGGDHDVADMEQLIKYASVQVDAGELGKGFRGKLHRKDPA